MATQSQHLMMPLLHSSYPFLLCAGTPPHPTPPTHLNHQQQQSHAAHALPTSPTSTLPSLPQCSPDYTSANLDLISIHANELELSKAGITSGAISGSVQGATDKGLVFEDVLLEEACRTPRDAYQGGQEEAGSSRRSSSGGGGGGRSLSVYVGDSTSDLLPLLGVSGISCRRPAWIVANHVLKTFGCSAMLVDHT